MNKNSEGGVTVNRSIMLAVQLGLVFTGSVTTICAKLAENPVEIKRGNTIEKTDFKHPLILNLFMFSGEALMLFLF